MVLGLAGGEPSPKVHMSVKVIVHVHACMASLQVEVDSLEYDGCTYFSLDFRFPA